MPRTRKVLIDQRTLKPVVSMANPRKGVGRGRASKPFVVGWRVHGVARALVTPTGVSDDYDILEYWHHKTLAHRRRDKLAAADPTHHYFTPLLRRITSQALNSKR